MKAGSGVRADVLALFLGLLGTVAWHWPLVASGLDLMPGDVGDARATIYLAEHWYQVFLGHAEALSPDIFYPVKGTIGYAETMFVHALPYSGLRLAGLDMFSAMAVPLVLFSFFNYAACYILLRRVLGIGMIASVAGSMFFAFNSPRFNHSGHYGYQASFCVPLVVACVALLVQRRANLSQLHAFGLLAAAALSLAVQFVISPYQGWFVVFWSCLFLAIVFSIRATRKVVADILRRFPLALAGGAIVLMIGMYPLLAIYMPAAASVGTRPYSSALELTPDAWSLIQMGESNFIWGGVSAALLRIHPLFSRELYIGIGLVPSLALLALMIWSVITIVREVRGRSPDRGRRDMRRLVLAASILASTLVYVLAMRYWGGGSPWHIVYRLVPGADGLRAIARHVMILALPMAIGFALLVHRALQRIAAQPTALARTGLTVALFAVVSLGIVEQFGHARSFSRTGQITRLKTLASSLPENCAVFYAAAAPGREPVKHEDQIDAMLISVMRGVPTVNGYSGHVPRGWSLREVEAPDYEQRVARWVARHRVAGPVCRLEIGD